MCKRGWHISGMPLIGRSEKQKTRIGLVIGKLQSLLEMFPPYHSIVFLSDFEEGGSTTMERMAKFQTLTTSLQF